MVIPTTFKLFGLEFFSSAVFVVVGVIIFVYLFWYQGKKDGFDEEKLFDLAIGSVLASLLAFRVDPFLIFALVISVVFFVSRLWNWSPFRILDMAVLALLGGLIVPTAAISFIERKYYLMVMAAVLCVSYFGFSYLRNYKLKSGYAFSLILTLVMLVGFFLVRDSRHLLFYSFLFIMASVVLILREKKSMTKIGLPEHLLNKLRDSLMQKRKSLKTQQKILIQEDPYLTPGRDTSNAETFDEALLEDSSKEVNDIKKSAIEKMQIQVRKALANMRLGSYGYCEVCHEPIDKARLEAYPEATTCFKHASNA